MMKNSIKTLAFLAFHRIIFLRNAAKQLQRPARNGLRLALDFNVNVASRQESPERIKRNLAIHREGFVGEHGNRAFHLVALVPDLADKFFEKILHSNHIERAVVLYLSRYSSYEFLAEYVLSSDEGISSAIQSALHQLVFNQAVTALRNGADEMIDVLYEDTKERE